MSPVANLGQPPSSNGAQVGIPQKPKVDAQLVAAARQALDRAQNRVDADKRARSPGCVAVDQKGVDTASADLVRAQAAENTDNRGTPDGSATVANRILSVTA